ncbi:MAG: methionyl-tRNA formyltransferase [Bryobacterales bacterium]|nr:methionyl-tRNA formyltransferase [Bryobacterales bacterium]
MVVVFMGTPAFAVASLEALAAAGHTVAAVYTQPDRPKGRGQELAISPVKEAALRMGLPVYQPERVRACVTELASFGAKAMVVVGYGQILPQAVIDLAPLGIVNVHASLLPLYRGAAPIQWAIANGETETGVTTMRIDAGLDTGDMLRKAETSIGPDETAVALSERLAAMGAELLIETLEMMERGQIVPEPQDHSSATLAPILKKEDGVIDWSLPAAVIFNRLRGFTPWPGATTTFRGAGLKILAARVLEGEGLAPGGLAFRDRQLMAGCGGGTALELVEVQPEGRKRVSGDSFANGARIVENEVLGI